MKKSVNAPGRFREVLTDSSRLLQKREEGSRQREQSLGARLRALPQKHRLRGEKVPEEIHLDTGIGGEKVGRKYADFSPFFALTQTRVFVLGVYPRYFEKVDFVNPWYNAKVYVPIYVCFPLFGHIRTWYF